MSTFMLYSKELLWALEGPRNNPPAKLIILDPNMYIKVLFEAM